MGRGVKIPWVGDQYTTEKGLYKTCVGASIYHGYWVQHTMGRGGQNTMGRGFDIPYVVGSKYHG